MNGQLIADKLVVPDVIKIKPEIVVDIHEDLWTEAGYRYPRFIYPISKDNKTKNIIKSIANNMTFLKIYSPEDQVRFMLQNQLQKLEFTQCI